MFRVNLADLLDNFYPDAKRLKTLAIRHVNLRAAAELTGKFLEGWLEIVFAKENAGQLLGV
jgi:hypothetical protein